MAQHEMEYLLICVFHSVSADLSDIIYVFLNIIFDKTFSRIEAKVIFCHIVSEKSRLQR